MGCFRESIFFCKEIGILYTFAEVACGLKKCLIFRQPCLSKDFPFLEVELLKFLKTLADHYVSAGIDNASI